jgi:acyl carrier protein
MSISSQEIEQKMIDFIAEKKNGMSITNTMSFRNDLGLDSVDLTEIIFMLEDFLNQLIDDEDLFKIDSITDVLGLINNQRKELA